MKKKSTAKTLWYLIAIGMLTIFFIILVSSVLNLGDRISTGIHPIASYVFYVIVVLLVWFLILNPIRIVVFSPAFSIETTLDSKSRRNYHVYKRVAKKLVQSEYLSETEKNRIKATMGDYDELRLSINHILDHSMKKEINKKIRNSAKTVLISTAVSQNGKLDAFSIIVVNIRMIKDIVVMCGFRPSFKNLARLTVSVLTTALIADGLENLDLADILPQSTMNLFSEIPFVKPLISSVTQGITNGLMTLRIGVVTRKFLFSDVKETSKDVIRRGAFIESAKMLPGVIGEAIVGLPKKFASIFKKNKVEEEAI